MNLHRIQLSALKFIEIHKKISEASIIKWTENTFHSYTYCKSTSHRFIHQQFWNYTITDIKIVLQQYLWNSDIPSSFLNEFNKNSITCIRIRRKKELSISDEKWTRHTVIQSQVNYAENSSHDIDKEVIGLQHQLPTVSNCKLRSRCLNFTSKKHWKVQRFLSYIS